MNFDQIQWETGDASGGTGGLGGTSARMGYSNGTPTGSFEEPGSGVNGAFLDSNATTGLIHGSRNSDQLGRYLFPVRSGRALQGVRPGDFRFTESFYINSVENKTRYLAAGRALGLKVRNGDLTQRVTVILDFGAQGYRDGNPVIQTHFREDVRAISHVEAIAERFAAGFAQAVGPTGPRYRPHLLLIVATNNSGRRSYDFTSCPDGRALLRYYCLGEEWAKLINRVDGFLRQPGAPPELSRTVTVRGGNDIEGGFCPSAYRAAGQTRCRDATRAWSNGYRAAIASTARYYINAGSCDGCQNTALSTDAANNVVQAGGWRPVDYHYVSTNGSYVLPQMYRRDGNMAVQWAVMAKYFNGLSGNKIVFWGSLTQKGNCDWNVQHNGPDKCGPGIFDNPARAGFTQLRDELFRRGLTTILIRQLTDIVRFDR
jgi:hypothetical protein